MTPAFYYEGDNLLRAQLRCLSHQVMKDFDVLLVDPHFSKRKDSVKEMAEKYMLNVVHIPYFPNQLIAKRLDCAVFNAPYCFSESQRIVRYSCWRFVRDDFTKTCVESSTNVDFRFHSCDPATPEDAHPLTNHNKKIWDMSSDFVDWSSVPSSCENPVAKWGPDADKDEPEQIFPRNAYGNYMVFRDQWISINGADEVFTNTAHYEDIDFCIRARNKGMTAIRKSHKIYRLHHYYGPHSGRANIVPDNVFKKCCDECEKACHVLEPKRFDIQNRLSLGEIEIIEKHKVWVCKKCHLSGPVYHSDAGEHCNHVESSKAIKSAIIPKYKIGRNLEILISDMDGKSLSDKIDIFKDSWENSRYYQQ